MDQLETWIHDGRSQNFSEKTLVEREGFMARFVWWLENEEGLPPTLDSLTIPVVRRYLSYLRAEHPTGRFGYDHPCSRRGAMPSTVFNYHRELAAFANWLVVEGFYEVSPLAAMKRPRTAAALIETFTSEQFKDLVAATAHSDYPLRNKVILLLLAETGVRVSELCQLTCGSIQSDGSFTVLGKGAKRRQCFTGQNTRRAVRSYLNRERPGAGDDEPLFLAEGSIKGLQPNGVRIMMKRVGKLAQIKGIRVSPHTLRHFYSLQCLRSGKMSGYALSASLGHSTLEMTKRYLNLTQADVQEAHAGASPIDRLRIT